MLKEAIEKIAKMAENKTYEIEGRTYSDKALCLIEEPYNKPCTLELNSLDSLCQMVKKEAKVFAGSGDGMLIVDVDQHNRVFVFTSYDNKWRRKQPYSCAADVPSITIGKYMSQQQAIIELRSLFIPNEDSRYLLNLLSRISSDSNVSSVDNGVTQRVEAKRGISLMENVEIKPRVSLRPFRTFLEVDQPESEFLLRLDDNGNVGLFPADGGVWKLEAKRNTADYIRDLLKEEIEAGKVMVIR